MAAWTDVERYELPSSFRFPTSRDFARDTAVAMNDIGFDSEFSRSNLVLPMQTHSNTLITALETTVGAKIDRLAGALTSGSSLGVGQTVTQIAGDVGSMIYHLVEGDALLALGAAKDVLATLSKTGAASDLMASLSRQLGPEFMSAVADVVPIVGAMISAVVQVVGMFDTGWSEEERDEAGRVANEQMHSLLKQSCPGVASAHQPSPTGATGVTPADMFRTSYIAAQLGHPMPPTLASMYVLLCGGETQGVGFTRREYDLFLNGARKRHGDVGIHPWVQRRMWALIKSIMSSIKDPGLARKFTIMGDQGRSSFALLQDILRVQCDQGRWTQPYAMDLARVLGSRYKFSFAYDVGDYASGMVVSDCGAGDYMLLDVGLMRAQRSWQSILEEEFCMPGTPLAGQPCRWRALPSAASIKRLEARRRVTGVKAIIAMGARPAADLIESVAGGAEREEEAVADQGRRRAAAVTGGLVTGAVAALVAGRVLGGSP